MLIAVLARDFSLTGGGAQRYCVEITKRMSKEHHVHVFTQNIGYLDSNIKYYKVPVFISRPRFLNQIFFSIYTNFLTRKKGYDVIHSHENVGHANAYTQHVNTVKSRYMSHTGIKKILRFLTTIISPRLLSYLILERNKMNLSKKKVIISVSHMLSENILSCYPKVEKFLFHAHPGIEFTAEGISDSKLDLYTKYEICERDVVMTFIGHEFRRKGLQTIINAIEKINNKNLHLIVCGKGDPSEIIINSSIVKKNTHFLGIVSNPKNILQQSHLLIHPTLNDTFGMVPLEAMSQKTAVIISNKDYCGLSYYLDSNNAMIVNPKDIEQIISSINFLIENKEERIRIAESGYNKSLEFSWDKSYKNTIQAFRYITNAK